MIANPIGPFEEPRFCSYLIRTWFKGEVPAVRTPLYVRDNIHVDLLAQAYATFAEKVPSQQGITKSSELLCREPGRVCERFAGEMSSRLGVACPVTLLQQEDFTEPMVRINTDRIDGTGLGWSETRPGMPKLNSTGRPQNNYRGCASTMTSGAGTKLYLVLLRQLCLHVWAWLSQRSGRAHRRGRTDALAGIVLAGAVGIAGVAGGIGQAQLADRDIAFTGGGGSNQQQGQHCTERELHGNLRLYGLRGCQKTPMRGGGEDHRCRFPACQSRTPRSCGRSLERP